MSTEQLKNLKSYLFSIRSPRAESARRRGVAPAALAAWINGRRRPPSNLAARIELCLELELGASVTREAL